MTKPPPTPQETLGSLLIIIGATLVILAAAMISGGWGALLAIGAMLVLFGVMALS